MARSRDKGGPADRRAAAGRTKRVEPWSWRQKVKRERARLTKDPSLAVCWLCGEPIDMHLPPGHKESFTLDHLIPVSRGGSWDGETKPAHLSCNASRGDGRKRRRGATPPTLLDW